MHQHRNRIPRHSGRDRRRQITWCAVPTPAGGPWHDTHTGRPPNAHTARPENRGNSSSDHGPNASLETSCMPMEARSESSQDSSSRSSQGLPLHHRNTRDSSSGNHLSANKRDYIRTVASLTRVPVETWRAFVWCLVCCLSVTFVSIESLYVTVHRCRWLIKFRTTVTTAPPYTHSSVSIWKRRLSGKKSRTWSSCGGAPPPPPATMRASSESSRLKPAAFWKSPTALMCSGAPNLVACAATGLS